jgi:hypothetical protein
MSGEGQEEVLTGFDLWTPNDYSNFVTICAAAIGSTLLVIFKSRCTNISLCCGLWSCDREVAEEDDKDKDKNKKNKKSTAKGAPVGAEGQAGETAGQEAGAEPQA